MTAFTCLGVVMFWMLCWQVGELIAKAIHLRSLAAAVVEPIYNELDASIAALTAHLSRATEEGDQVCPACGGDGQACREFLDACDCCGGSGKVPHGVRVPDRQNHGPGAPDA